MDSILRAGIKKGPELDLQLWTLPPREVLFTSLTSSTADTRGGMSGTLLSLSQAQAFEVTLKLNTS